MQSFVDVLWL